MADDTNLNELSRVKRQLEEAELALGQTQRRIYALRLREFELEDGKAVALNRQYPDEDS